MAEGPRRRRPLFVALVLLAGLVVFAYGFQATKVNLDQIQAERRQQNLFRILRALARPEIIEYDTEDTATDVPIYVPCPEGDLPPAESEGEGPRLVVIPSCVDPRSNLVVEGSGFAAATEVTLYFVPTSQVQLRLSQVRTDAEGAFTATVLVPSRADPEVQAIRAIGRHQVGAPRLTETAHATWDGIIETVFLALIATTFGILVAIPLSFFAARNLMRDISTPLLNLALAFIAFPLGVWGAILLARWAAAGADALTSSVAASVAGVVLVPVVIWQLMRWALPPIEQRRAEPATRVVRALVLVVVGGAGLFLLYLVADVLQVGGDWAAPRLGPFGFLGSFLATIGELVTFGTAVLAALFGSGLAVSLANRLGWVLRANLPYTSTRLLAVPLSMLAGAILAIAVARTIGWFYQWEDAFRLTWAPAAIGALLGVAVAIRAWKRESVMIGLSIYYFSRTVFNALRSVEPLVMALVFVVWVGIGPFAGSLALALHTIAALAKLYSEQVESILPGPLEAVRATGATRLQTVVYAVMPQIVPPYISFTMYRWDINVRMSTIIGFVGGGGIGLILQQNINLLNYRAAAAQMLAIAIVVASMDWLSSTIRERFV